jgi:hypothetical protein
MLAGVEAEGFESRRFRCGHDKLGYRMIGVAGMRPQFVMDRF